MGSRGGSTVRDVKSYTSVMEIAHGNKKEKKKTTSVLGVGGVRASSCFLPNVKTPPPPPVLLWNRVSVEACSSCFVLRRLAVEASRRWWWRWLAEPSTPEPPPSSRSLTTSSQVVFCSAEPTLPPACRVLFVFFVPSALCGRIKNVLAERDHQTNLLILFKVRVELR